MNFAFLYSDVFLPWLVGAPIVFILLDLFFRLGGWWPATVRGSNGADMMAFQITSCLLCLYVAVAGCMGWWGYCPGCDLEPLHADKVYGRSDFFERNLSAPLLSLQFWNIVICLIMAELRDAVMLLHHLSALLCAFFSVDPFLQYYGLFFYGVPEVSSVPLTFVSMSKSFPFLKKNYPLLYDASKWSFGLTFITFRLVLWTKVIYLFLVEMFHLLTEGNPHSMFVVGYYCTACVILTSMQYFWGYKIISQMVGSGKSDKKKK